MSDELRNIISQASNELNPVEDNQVVESEVTEEAIEDLEPGIEITDEEDFADDSEDNEIDDSDEIEDEEVEEETEESEKTEDNDSKKYVVKVDGEKFEVTLDELKAGYQRQADYTREKQALKAEIEQIEAVKTEYSEQLSAIQELDIAWEDNPVTVLTHLATNTENPTQALAMMIRDMAALNVLDPQFLQMFGITPDVQSEWRQQYELDNLKKNQTRTESQKTKELDETRLELEVQKAIAEYDNQIDEIIEQEGYNFNTKQRNEFRKQLASYAAENELTNLKTAFKAFKYEESQKKQKLAAKTVEKAKAKKANNVVSRNGAGQGNPVTDTSDLSAVIRQAMKESNL